MKIFKPIVLTVVGLLVAGAIGGAIYMRRAFSAPPNTLAVTPNGQWIEFQWAGDGNGDEARQALLVPLRYAGQTRTYWLQFDVGAPYSVMYSGKLAAIAEHAGGPVPILVDGKSRLDDVDLNIGPQPVHARQLRVRTTRAGIDWKDPASVEIIGTLGADFIDGRVLVIDYPNHRLALWPAVPASLAARTNFSALRFKERRVLLAASINDQPRELMFDTGSSAFALLTSRSEWNALAKPGATPRTYTVSSWGQPLQANLVATDAVAKIGGRPFVLGEVATIDGMGWMQEMLTRLSGLGGMTGNRLFLDHVIIVDTRAGRFGVVADRVGDKPRQ
jgi:hypothetical protein